MAKNTKQTSRPVASKMELCKCMGSEVNQWWYTEVQCEPYHSEV